MSKKIISNAELLEKNNYQQIPQKKDQSLKNLGKKSVLKGLIFIIIFIICLVWAWYHTQNNYKNNNVSPSTVLKNQNSKEDEPVVNSSSKGIMMLDVGSYSFNMEAGEETDWIQLPNKAVRYRIGSPGDRWIIIFDDGKTVKGWDSEPLPYRELAKFKIKSLQKQCIKINIAER